MLWTNITAGTPLKASNAKTLSGVLPGRSVMVKALHPGTGPDATLKIVGPDGSVVSQLALSSKRPEPPADYFEIADPNVAYNYVLEPVDATWPSPGITIQVDAPTSLLSTYNPSTGGSTSPGTSNGQTYNPTTQETTFPGSVRAIVRGQSVRSDGNLFLLGPGNAFANVVAETDCFTAPVAGLVDGAYVTDSADGGIPPIIRAGFLLPTGTEKGQGLRIKASCGIAMAAATLSASSLASKLTLKAYLINLATSTRIQIASIDVRASQIANADPSTSLPCDFVGTIAPSSLVSGTIWNTRNHDFVILASGNYGAQFAGFKEQSAYPQIDWGVDQGIIFTQQWDSGYPAGTFYFNQLSVERE